MTARLNIAKVAPGAYHSMLGLEKFIRESSIEEKLVHLLKMRASQINGCAYCLDMRGRWGRRSSGSTASTPGARHPITPNAIAPRWSGSRR